MTEAVPNAGAPSRRAFVDSLRLLAASLVLLQHLYEGRPGLIRSIVIPLAPGVAGVAIFFFISGYVIPMAARRGLNAREFLIRRLFRIYPLYLVTLGLMAIAGATRFLPQLGFVADAPARAWMANILLVAEYMRIRPFLGVSWTLAIELIWYALFAGSCLMFGKRAADRLDVFVPVAFLALAALSLAIGTRIPLGRPTMIYAAVIGFQCYRFHAHEIDGRRLARSVAVFAGVALFGNYVAFGIFAHPNLTLSQATGPWIVATTVFLLVALYRPLRTSRLMNAGLIPAIGAMSYSVYLLHPLAAAVANSYAARDLQVPAAIVMTLALSWIGFNCVEKPGIALGRMCSRPHPPLAIEARVA